MSPTSYLTAPPRLELEMVGLGRFELPTSRLSGVRSNQLSYRPSVFFTAILAAKKSHTSLLRSVINGGHAGGPCSFGGYLKIACDLLNQVIKEQNSKRPIEIDL